jgi:hypothetical protein
MKSMKNIAILFSLLFAYCATLNTADERYVGTWEVNSIWIRKPVDTSYCHGSLLSIFNRNADSICNDFKCLKFNYDYSLQVMCDTFVIQSGFWSVSGDSLKIYNLSTPTCDVEFYLFEGKYSTKFTAIDTLRLSSGNLLEIEYGLIYGTEPHLWATLQKQ